jgi:hypothetical protein
MNEHYEKPIAIRVGSFGVGINNPNPEQITKLDFTPQGKQLLVIRADDHIEVHGFDATRMDFRGCSLADLRQIRGHINELIYDKERLS